MKQLFRLLSIIFMVILSFMMWITLDIKEKKKVKPIEKQVSIHRSDGSVEKVELETYLIGVVGSEMPVSFEMEALKAQSVAARTFVIKRNYEVDNTTSSQVYHNDDELKLIWKDQYDSYRKKIEMAVSETEGEILTYENEPITAAFYSSSPGYTNNVEDYWNSPLPYLVSVESVWDSTSDSKHVQSMNFSKKEIGTLLGFQNEISYIQIISYYKSGYVKKVVVDGLTFSGREIREKLGLRSNWFTISVDEYITFTTKGYGHGIGLSQYGANGMAKEGYTYDKILKHYYTGVTLEKMNK